MKGTCFRTSENGGNGSPNGGDVKRMRRSSQSKTMKVNISFAAKIPVQAIGNALRGQDTENSQEALRVLDIILRQIAAKQYVRDLRDFGLILFVPSFMLLHVFVQGMSAGPSVIFP